MSTDASLISIEEETERPIEQTRRKKQENLAFEMDESMNTLSIITPLLLQRNGC